MNLVELRAVLVRLLHGPVPSSLPDLLSLQAAHNHEMQRSDEAIRAFRAHVGAE